MSSSSKIITLLRSGSIILAISSLLSRLLGLVRDRLLTHMFGATRIDGGISELDAYYAAFQLPDLLYQIIILGTISACFIPYFSELYQDKKGPEFRLRWSFPRPPPRNLINTPRFADSYFQTRDVVQRQSLIY